MNQRLKEVFRFVFTGGLCFVIEFVCLVALVSGLHMDTLLATPIAFLISVAVNYLLCIRWVFKTDGSGGAQLGFLVTSVIGLFLNELLMLLFRVLFGETQVLFTLFGFAVTMYMVSKAMATLIAMVWNYFTKRAVLQSEFIRKLTQKADRKK